MRSVVVCLVLVLVAFGACGPSAAELQTAKLAHYNGSPDELYAIAQQAAAEDYKIGEQDPAGHRFATVPQWYNPEGGR
jgi:hypothetical protein